MRKTLKRLDNRPYRTVLQTCDSMKLSDTIWFRNSRFSVDCFRYVGSLLNIFSMTAITVKD